MNDMMKTAGQLGRAAAKGIKAGMDASRPADAPPPPRSAMEAGARANEKYAHESRGKRALRGAGAGALHGLLRALGLR